ncbi:MAG: 50S ribosomal protein L21 [Bdellovibrionales bacterium]
MYAIIRTGGKQYSVKPGDLVRVEKLDSKLGSEFELNEVLYVGGDKPQFGSPLVSGATVGVVVTQHNKAGKILVFKKKRRKGYRRLKGHRQPYTELFVSYISADGKTAKADSKPHVIDREKIAAKKVEIRENLKAKPKSEDGAKKAAPKKGATPAKKKTGKKKAGAAKGKTAAKKRTGKSAK